MPNRTCSPCGPSSSPALAIVGEAPGKDEERAGTPFIGKAGYDFRYLLSSCGLSPQDIYWDNILPWRPGRLTEERGEKVKDMNNFSKHLYSKGSPRPELLSARLACLERLEEVNPTLTILCGNEPLEAFTGQRGISNWRGSILRASNGLKVLPTLHPSFYLRGNYPFRTVVAADLKRARRECTTPDISYPKVNLVTVTSMDQLRALIHLWRTARNPLSFDIETNGLHRITCIGFAADPTYGYSIPTPFDGRAVQRWNLIASLLEDPYVPKIAQNAQFDCTYLARTLGIHVQNLWFDCMVASHALYAELPKSLAFQASIFTDFPYWKDDRTSPEGATLYEYNARDAVVTYSVAVAEAKELQEFKCWKHFARVVMPTYTPLMVTQNHGMRVDVEKRDTLISSNREALEVAQGKLDAFYQLMGEEGSLNVKSTPQMQEFLYRMLKLPRRVKGGTLRTDEDVIREHKTKVSADKAAALQLVLDVRHLRTIHSNYLKPLEDPDGFTRCVYSLTGTKTGRLNSKKTLEGTGRNMQNFNPSSRSQFIPREGNVFISRDYSQSEARIIAWLAGEEYQIRLFEEGGDVHSKMAVSIFGCTLEEVRKPLPGFQGKTPRDLAKRAVHAGNYLQTPKSLAVQMDITEASAQRAQLSYFRTSPHIRSVYHSGIISMVRKGKILRTPLGRRRVFLDRPSDAQDREAVNFIPQSVGSAELTHLALTVAYWTLPPSCLIVQHNHDSLLLDVPRDQATLADSILKGCMERPFPVKCLRDHSPLTHLTIPTEGGWGVDWEDVYKPLSTLSKEHSHERPS